MNLLSTKTIRIAACAITFTFGMMLVSTPAFSRGWYPSRSYHGMHHFHAGHGDDFLPALFATAIIAGVTYSIIDNAYSYRAPESYVVVNRPVPVAPYALVPQTGSTGSVVVTAALLNVRSGPGLGNPSILQLPSGTVLSVFGNAPGWYYVKAPNNLCGWVMAQFTAPSSLPASG